MSGNGFLQIIKTAFVPFLKDLGFLMSETSISGRFYRASFLGRSHSIWVSFEPGDSILFVIVFGREDGKLSDIDDPMKTPRLADLNRRYMASVTNEQRAENEIVFETIFAHDKDERLLLKSAKELRLVLPRYLHY